MVTVEDLLGPLNEIERKHAPEQLWIGGDASIFELGTLAVFAHNLIRLARLLPS